MSETSGWEVFLVVAIVAAIVYFLVWPKLMALRDKKKTASSGGGGRITKKQK